MNYQSLSDIITRFSEKIQLTREEMERFEVAVVRKCNGQENVMLAGLMPENKYGATPLIMGCCQMKHNIILTDSERIDCFAIRQTPKWEEDFYDFGTRLGIDRGQLEQMLMEILSGKQE